MKSSINKKVCLWTLLAAIIVVALALGLYFGLRDSDREQKILRGAVVSSGAMCAPIGQIILEEGGSAVDAAIATLFCDGVILTQSMGIGGGFLATIYHRETGKVVTLNARESAPLAATFDMFVNVTSITGAIAVAVPGEVLGYFEMHKKFGKLPWKTLIEPTIKLCRQGHPVSAHMHTALKKHEVRIRSEPSMRDTFINPKTGNVWEQGDVIRRLKLAETLEVIAVEGSDTIYNGGKIGKMLAKDIQDMGGIITEQDFKQYSVQWKEPTIADFQHQYTVYSMPLPGSGALLSLILNIMSDLITTDRPLLWHRLVESFKHAYGQRTNLGDMDFEPSVEPIYTKINDPDFATELRQLILDDRTFQDFEYYGANFTNEEDHGTANMAVLAPNGDAVVVTSTVNNYFGAKVQSTNTGIVLNDEMDDFSTPGTVNGFGIPASPANYIKPQKRPMSSMCPTIILDKNGNVKLLAGAAGGSKITTAVSQLIVRYLLFNETLFNSIQAKRLHHQLAPMRVDHEQGIDEEIKAYLTKVGHVVQVASDSGFAALTAIGAKSKIPIPVYDERRVGGMAYVSITT